MTALCRLYVITPALTAAGLDPFAPRFAAALAAGEVASALLRIAPGSEGEARRIVAPLLEVAAAADVALLIENDPRLAARAGADGAHITGVGQALTDALKSLKPERIVGVGGLVSRDDAMIAGEAGVDYVMFGEPHKDGWIPPFAATLERVDWWAEIFETPCVAFAAALDEAERLAAAGADFVALGEALWAAPDPAIVATEAKRRFAAVKGLRP